MAQVTAPRLRFFPGGSSPGPLNKIFFAMKKHAIIPVFIPHLGCPYDCVFCNQKEITAREEAPDPEEIRKTIDQWLSTLEGKEVEIAFYGGSFTGIPMELQSAYLDVAVEYKEKGLVQKLHLSTRPDFINREILDNLKAHQVDVIELGAQSFDNEVLRLSGRGHSADQTRQAAALIREYGFQLGIQLMIGLPGDSFESCIMSAEEAVKLKPDLARLYPTIVLDNTPLFRMYESGRYRPLSREEAVRTTAEMYKILDDAGIYIMRVGLKSTDIIGDGGAVNGGTYHPAFRQLVEGRIAREKILPMLEAVVNEKGPELMERPGPRRAPRRKVDVYANPESFSNMIGNSGENRKYFEEKFPQLNLKYGTDETLGKGEFRVVEK